MAPCDRPVMRVLIGAPGSGKTTWCANHERDTLGVVLSTDDARLMLSGDASDQSVSAAAFDWVHQQASAALAAGRAVTIDATGASRRDRARWVRLAAEQNATPVAVVFRVRYGVCTARNRARPRQVPDKVLWDMWRRISALTPQGLLREGFADIVSVTAPAFDHGAPAEASQ